MLKEVFLGIALMVGGLVLAMAVLLKPGEPSKAVEETAKEPVAKELVPVANKEATVDLQTEASVLEVKYRDRQAELEEKTAEAEALRAKQEEARELALQKSELEAQQVSNKLEVKPRPESELLAKEEAERKAAEQAKEKEKALQAQKTANTKNNETKPQDAKQDVKAQKSETKDEPKRETTVPKTYVVKSGDSLIRLSRQYNIPVSAIAEMNGMGRNDTLQRGRTIRLPSAKDIKDLEVKAQKREREAAAKKAQEQKRKDINERLGEARREAKRQGVNDGYVVQVALASNQDKADELVKQYKQAGYAVQTIKEGRGVRVIVGSERSKEAANILKEKINNDSRVSANGAWVLKK